MTMSIVIKIYVKSFISFINLLKDEFIQKA